MKRGYGACSLAPGARIMKLALLAGVLCPVSAFFVGQYPLAAGLRWSSLGDRAGERHVLSPSRNSPLMAAQIHHHHQGNRRGPDVRELNKNIMYWGKRRDFKRVMELLEQLEREGLEPNIYTFNALMNACVICRTGEQVTNQLWERMLSSGLRPNAITYNTLIKRFFGSKSASSATQALQVLQEMEKERVLPDVMTFNELINICVETGEMQRATDLVREMEGRGIRPDIMTYTTLIKGYGLKGNLTSAFDTLQRMRAENVPLTTYSCNVLADACIRCAQPAKALKLFRDFETSSGGGGLRMLDIKSYNIMIKAYREMGRLEGAWETLEELRSRGFEPDMVTYNTLIDTCCKHQQPEAARLLIQEMREKGVRVDHKTLHPLLLEEVVQSNANVEAALGLANGLLSEYGFTPNDATVCTLMEAMVDMERPADAVGIFIDHYLTPKDGPAMPAPSNMVYNTLIKAYREYILAADPEDDLPPLPLAIFHRSKPPTVGQAHRVGDVLEACMGLPTYMRRHDHASHPDSITFNILLDLAAELGDIEALNVVAQERRDFGLGLDHYLIHAEMKCHAVRGDLAGVTEVKERMDRLRVPPNERTFSVLVLALLRCGEVAKAELLLRNALARTLYIHDSLFMAFLQHYASSGQGEAVDSTFRAYQDKVKKWNASVWNSYIGALAVLGQVEKAEESFEQMAAHGFRPTSLTYFHLIRASCVGRDLENAMSWLSTMRRRALSPDVKVYNWVIHACLDVGDTQRLIQVLQEMEADGVAPNRVTARAKDRILRALASRIKNVGESVLSRLGRSMGAQRQ